jgi:phosphinothricin acetyltransferase
MARRIVAAGERYPWLAFEQDGTLAGYAYASAHRSRAAYRWSVDVSVYVDATVRRSGIGSRLYAKLFEILAAQGFHSAFAGVTLPNDASLALHLRAGFSVVGTYHAAGFKFGAWRDTRWFERRLVPSDAEPAEPRTLDDIEIDWRERS